MDGYCQRRYFGVVSTQEPDITEAIARLKERLNEQGYTIVAACDEAGVSRQSFYALARPRGGMELGPEHLRALAQLAQMSDVEELELLVAWLYKRFAVGATSGPMRVAFKVINDLPRAKRDRIYREMIDAYEDRRGTTRSRR